MAKTSFVFFGGLLLLFVITISEIEAGVAPKLCEKNSQTYTGKCDNKACDKKCIQWEKAMTGVCHLREAKVGCYCYYDCKKAPPASKPAPPNAAIPPPPAGGAGGGAGGGSGGGAGGADGGGSGGGAGGGAGGGGVGDGAGGGGADGGSPPPPTPNNPCHCPCMKIAK